MSALFLLLFAIGLFIPIFAEFLQTGRVPKIPTLIISSILGLSALLSAFRGLILDTVAKNARKDFEIKINLMKMLSEIGGAEK